MKKNEKGSNKYTDLRKKAEIVLKKNIIEFDEPSFTDIKQLIEELQLYHIELEMQNEELQKTLEALEESRNKFSDLYDFAPVGYFTLDNSGTILNVNVTGANLLGVERYTLLKKRFSDFVNKDDQDTFYFHRQTVLESKVKQTCELRIRKKDNAQFFGLLESIAVEDSEGNSNKYRTTITDITDRKRIEDELQKHRNHLEDLVKMRTKVLEQTNAELETYAYSVAHDMRASIRAIQSFGELLITDYGKQLDIEGKNYLNRIIDSSQRMNIITEDLLKYSQINRIKLDPKPIDLNKIINEVLDQLETKIKEKNAVIDIKTPLPNVIGDKVNLTTVIFNILINALIYVELDTKPKIKIWSEKHNRNIRLYIEDNGIGIDPEYHEKIFQVFERLHGPEAYPGTGVGLTIVKKGINQMNGKVGVESEVGEGARFWLELKEG